MIKRLFWLGLGVTVGVLVVRKLTKKAESYSPRGIARSARSSAGNVADSARGFLDDVRGSMREREEELLDTLAADNPSFVDKARGAHARSGG